MNKCIFCNQDTNNPKFCSNSCSAKYNNKLSPKRTLTNTCASCGILIVSSRKFCYDCYDKHEGSWKRRTISEVRSLNGHKMSAYSRIRDYARKYYFKHNEYLCKACGYDKHVEVCHIIAINTFNENTLLGTINSLDNLIGLCPNCHWEFDNGLLSIRGLDYTLTIAHK